MKNTEERWIFWLGYWACFGKSMAIWLALVCLSPLVADTSSMTPFSVVGSFVLWAAMAAIWSIDQGRRAVQRLRG